MAQRLTTLEELGREQQYQSRLQVVVVLVGIGFALLLLRLIFLQAIEHQRFHTLAESNRISIVPSAPNRGLITDRNGVVLAENTAVYTLEIDPTRVSDLPGTLDALAELVRIDEGTRKRFLQRIRETRRLGLLPVRSFLSDEEVARFTAQKFRFPGVELSTRLYRHYPFGESAAHVLGHVGRISAADKAAIETRGENDAYRGIDAIGKDGIEKTYEAELRGIAGYRKVETDASGHGVRTLSSHASVPGNRLRLAIDIRLQQVAEQAFEGRRGAAVAIEPATGDVLALVSQPSFDPNLFVDGIDVPNWRRLNDSPDRPLTNRPLRGAYPPGSTIKPFMALAGLESGLRRPQDSVFDPGWFSLPGSSHRYRCWKREGHGRVDMHVSVVQSCDIYYYSLAVDMGIQRMHDFLARFNFGVESGIDIGGERSGLNPSEAWKRARFRDRWYTGDSVSAGIGQGYMLATPMQLAYATAIFANRGVAWRPHLAKEIVDSRTGKTRVTEPQPVFETHFNEAHLDLVAAAMVAVTEPGGTAAAAFRDAPYKTAGKTGTAQVIAIKQGQTYRADAIDERHRDHAWFIAYAPAEAPTIAVAVLVENGGSGSGAAAPVARRILDQWIVGSPPADEVAP